MKKLLIGTMTAAMAVTAFASTGTGNVASVPVNATIEIGMPVTDATISIEGTLDFGTLKVNTGYNAETTDNTKHVKVVKTVGNQKSYLNPGEYQYKIVKEGDTWENDKQWAQTTGTDEQPNAFKLNGQGNPVKIGSDHNGYAYAVRAVSDSEGLKVWIAGDIADEFNNSMYTVGANAYVAFLDAVK